jgi:hypothetical protein
MKNTDVPQPGSIFLPQRSRQELRLILSLLGLRRRAELQMPL